MNNCGISRWDDPNEINARLKALTSQPIWEVTDDFAGSHNADCLAVQIKSGKTGKAEIKITGADISLIGMPVDCEQQCHCMLCHSVRGVRRDTEYPDFPETCSDIYIVESRTPQGDHSDSKRMQFTNNGIIQRIIDEYTYAVKPACQRNSIFVQLCLKILHFQPRPSCVCVKTRTVIRLGIEKGNFHTCTSPDQIFSSFCTDTKYIPIETIICGRGGA